VSSGIRHGAAAAARASCRRCESASSAASEGGGLQRDVGLVSISHGGVEHPHPRVLGLGVSGGGSRLDLLDQPESVDDVASSASAIEIRCSKLVLTVRISKHFRCGFGTPHAPLRDPSWRDRYLAPVHLARTAIRR
jgi:hypothetical protein